MRSKHEMVRKRWSRLTADSAQVLRRSRRVMDCVSDSATGPTGLPLGRRTAGWNCEPRLRSGSGAWSADSVLAAPKKRSRSV
jgi:hypothetical protein